MVVCLDSLAAPGATALPRYFEWEDFSLQNVLVFLAQNNIIGRKPSSTELHMTVLTDLVFCFALFQTEQVFIFQPLGQIVSAHQLDQIVAILSAARYHKAAFKGNWLFIYVSACCHILFTLLTEKPFMSQNWFHMLPLLPAWQYCRALTLSAGRPKTGVASDAGCKYLYILSFCLCANCSVSEQGIANGMWVMGLFYFEEEGDRG